MYFNVFLGFFTVGMVGITIGTYNMAVVRGHLSLGQRLTTTGQEARVTSGDAAGGVGPCSGTPTRACYTIA